MLFPSCGIARPHLQQPGFVRTSQMLKKDSSNVKMLVSLMCLKTLSQSCGSFTWKQVASPDALVKVDHVIQRMQTCFRLIILRNRPHIARRHQAEFQHEEKFLPKRYIVDYILRVNVLGDGQWAQL